MGHREEREPAEIRAGSMERIRRTREQMRKLAVVSAVIIVLAIVFCVAMFQKVLTPMNYYNQGIDRMYREEYAAAIECFEKAAGFKDSEEQIRVCESYLSSDATGE